MQRSNSGNIKSGASGGGGKKHSAATTKNFNSGFKRRNSTSVSSIKLKKPPQSALKAAEKNAKSFEQDDETFSSPPSTSTNSSVKVSITDDSEGTTMTSFETRLSVTDELSETEAKSASENEDDNSSKSANEEDLMAELNANLANIIERDKAKKSAKKTMFKIETEDDDQQEPEREEDSPEPSIDPRKLLKPSDIPQHVLEEKKNNITTKKTESNNNASSATANNPPTPEKKASPTASPKKEQRQPVTNNTGQAPASPTKTRNNNDSRNAVPPKTPAKKKKQSNMPQMMAKKSKFLIPPEEAGTLTKQQRERKLKEIVVQTFKTARARNERAMKNKWLRWKYWDDINRKNNSWLESNGVEDMGWAVGRRIYEKEEIEKVDEKLKMREKSSMFQSRNMSLKEASAEFGIWDRIYHPNVLKTLDNNGRWDPSKAHKEMVKKKEAQKAAESDEEEEEDDDDEDDEEEDDDEADSNAEEQDDNEPEYDEDGNLIEKKKKKKKKKKKDKKKKFNPDENGLSAEALKLLLKQTSYTEIEIRKWYVNFMEECPSGKLSRAHLQRLFKRVFPIGDSEHFCDYIFRLFDDDQNNVLEFTEFLQAIDVVTRKSEEEKLKWAFRLFDKDGSGQINVHEMASVLETVEGLDGKVPNPNNKGGLEGSTVSRATYAFAEKVFKLMDDDRNGEINVEEFIKGYQKLKARQNSTSVTVTAYVHERSVVRHPRKPAAAPEPVPTVSSRRKSLKDGDKVKSLFGNKKSQKDIPEDDDDDDDTETVE